MQKNIINKKPIKIVSEAFISTFSTLSKINANESNKREEVKKKLLSNIEEFVKKTIKEDEEKKEKPERIYMPQTDGPKNEALSLTEKGKKELLVNQKNNGKVTLPAILNRLMKKSLKMDN